MPAAPPDAPSDSWGADVTLGSAPTMTPVDAPSSLASLAAQVFGGDNTAIDELLTRVHQQAFRYARARLGPFSQAAHASEDVAQEVCIAVLKSLPRYVDRGVPFEAFVYSICSRKVADVQRSAYRLPVPTDVIPDSADLAAGPEESTLRRDEAERAWSLLEELPAQQREVLTLRVAVGLSAEEVATSLGMTAGSVRVSQHRALNRLRALMNQRTVTS